MYSYGPQHMAVQKQDDHHEHTFSSYVRIQDVVLKTCLGRWTIGRSGERGSGISVLPARHDDDDDIYIPKIKNKNQFTLILTSDKIKNRKWAKWGENSSPLFYPLPSFFPVSVLNYFIHKIWRSPVNFFRVFDLYQKHIIGWK